MWKMRAALFNFMTCQLTRHMLYYAGSDYYTKRESETMMTTIEEIQRLKEEKNAVILAHYYTRPEIQQIADYTGDSFKLSKIAADLPNPVMVYCGVSFMGESACLLSPEKKVLMPDMTADCPMAHMVLEKEVEEARRQYADLAVVCYINSTAEIKSWSDVSVTSANAVNIVRNLPNQNILFIPDKNLGAYVKAQVPEKNVMLVKGYCPIHEVISAAEIQALKEAHTQAEVAVHPECNGAVNAIADYIGSTSGILNHIAQSEKKEWIIGTEVGVLYELERQNPDKVFYFPETLPVCADMKLITLEKVRDVLRDENHLASVAENHAEKAKQTLDKMLELA